MIVRKVIEKDFKFYGRSYMKVLILSASTGGGHMRASSALKAYIEKNSEGASVEIVDTFKYISPLLNKTVTEGYVILATRTPKMYGSIYKNTNNKEKGISTLALGLIGMFSKKLIPLLEKTKPDLIISTHPFPTEMASILKEKGNIEVPLLCVMTDYAPHLTWIHSGVNAYIVSNEGMVEPMVEMGVPRERIYPFGIPIHEVFLVRQDKSELLKQFDLNPELPTILIMAGSFGVTDILKIYNTIVKIPTDFQMVVITGRNERLYEAFERLLNKSVPAPKRPNPEKSTAKPKPVVKVKAEKPKKPTKLVYFTNEVEKYMQAADFIITKPGGLTVSEALASGLPMAIFDAIPGQEEENAEFLIGNNMAVRLEKGESCGKTIEELLQNKEKLNTMRDSCEAFGKGNSTENIFALIHELLKQDETEGKAEEE